MKPKQIKDVKVGGYFTINGKVYMRVSSTEVAQLTAMDAVTPATLDPERSCLPLDRRGAQVILDHK